MIRRWLTLSALVAAPLALVAEQPIATFSSFNDWIGSEARGVRIGADGRLRLAPHLRRVAQLPEGVVWSVLPDGAGGLFLSCGTDGKIFRYSGGAVKPFTQVKGGIVFAMTRLGQDLIVAPAGEGKLMRVTPNGDVRPFCEVEARLVWALHTIGNEVVVAGGGEKGAVLLLAREGNSRRLAEMPDETSFTAMLPDGHGGYYLGTHGRGLVARYQGGAGGERVETLMATGFEEVRALAMHQGDILVGASNGLATKISSGTLERRETYVGEPGGNTRCGVLRLKRDMVPEVLWQSGQSQIYALTVWKNQLLVGTGNRSRIFAIPLEDRARALDPFTALQDLGAGQATAFVNTGSDLTVVASNPAELHVLSEVQATEGTLESKVLKGNPIADWGRAYVESDTPAGTAVELQFRVGNTESPDGTWTPWTPPLRSGERPSLKPTRFSQFRVRLTSGRGGSTPAVEEVRVHWAARNLAPIWEGVDVMPSGVVITRSAPAEDIGIERVPLEVQKLIPALGYMGSEKRSYRRGSQAFVFKVSDPNQDQLSFGLRLIPEQGSPIELETAWKERFFTLDTLPVPDGKYRLEVTASDSPSQPFNGALTSVWRTQPFLVDHTPPTISELSATVEGANLRVRFVARDAASVLKDVCVGGDGSAWMQVVPEDRVFDAMEERFDVVIPRDRLKGDRVLVRVTDLSGNEQSATVMVGEPGRKR